MHYLLVHIYFVFGKARDTLPSMEETRMIPTKQVEEDNDDDNDDDAKEEDGALTVKSTDALAHHGATSSQRKFASGKNTAAVIVTMLCISMYLLLLWTGAWNEGQGRKEAAKEETPPTPIVSRSRALLLTNHANGNTNASSAAHASSSSSSSSSLSLRLGDLPGYTGWARGATSMAGAYSVVIPSSSSPLSTSSTISSHRPWNVPRTGTPWTVRLACRDHKQCRGKNPNFYVRAYGPSVLTGVADKVGLLSSNAAAEAAVYYDVTFLFFDPGVYFVEVVLGFSDTPDLSTYPIAASISEPLYEGFLLPDFPMRVRVVTEPPPPHGGGAASSSSSSSAKSGMIMARNSNSTHQPPRLCQMHDFRQTSLTSALERGRWVVTHRVRGHGVMPASEGTVPLSLDGYQAGSHSLGVRMEYRFADCQLATLSRLTEAVLHKHDNVQTTSKAKKTNKKTWHFVFVGDSNMRLQYALARQLFPKKKGRSNKVQITFVPTNDGLIVRLPDIAKQLGDIAKKTTDNDDVVVLFNAGLHDLDKYCAQRWLPWRQEVFVNYTADDGRSFLCLASYRLHLRQLTQLIKTTLPFARLVVFETTTAAWPKHGNYGFAWSATEPMEYPHDPSACHVFNQEAWTIMKEFQIPVMDTFYLTLARPDHRESSESNAIGRKLVHGGPEIYKALMQQWLQWIVVED